jgi:hypothetical protein
MQAICVEHPAEAVLERYLLNHAPAGEFDEVETHLFVCERCMDRVEEIQDFRTALRDGLRLLREEAARSADKKAPNVFAHWFNELVALRWWSASNMPRWAFVPALGALAFGLLLLFNVRQPSGTVFDASLSAMRGDESGPVIPAGRKVQFHLDLQGVASTPASVQVVDGEGRSVGPVQPLVAGERPSIQLPPFVGGTYLLRVYATKDGHADQDKLLREFCFQAK